jgi:hypothetical protein
MKRLSMLVLTAATLSFVPPAHGAGVIIDQVKAHIDQHQGRIRLGEMRPALPPPLSSLEDLVRAVLDSLATRK